MKKHFWLLPASWLYGIGVGVRNKLYDWGLLASESFDLPVISVGNITVGGTGKTPFTEYLVRLLQERQKVAFLSRGYRRRSHGYILADASATARTIGDEPRQVQTKYPDIYVAVDADRRHAIHRLISDNATADTDVVLLDDGYQHRRVTPGLNILLLDYHRMPYEDRLLPVGRLRESFHSRERAHIIVVTKCPSDIHPIDFRVISNHLALRPFQRLFFTTLRYGDLRRLDDGGTRSLSTITASTSILLVTGIANPQPLIDELKQRTLNVSVLSYPDHHRYRASDYRLIHSMFDTLGGNDRLIVTTEKDAVRLLDDPAAADLLPFVSVLPVEVVFLKDQAETFDNFIISYVTKNSRNSIVHQGTHAHRS